MYWWLFTSEVIHGNVDQKLKLITHNIFYLQNSMYKFPIKCQQIIEWVVDLGLTFSSWCSCLLYLLCLIYLFKRTKNTTHWKYYEILRKWIPYLPLERRRIFGTTFVDVDEINQIFVILRATYSPEIWTNDHKHFYLKTLI